MDINEATDLVRGGPATIEVGALREKLSGLHSAFPQRAQMAHHALDSLEEALGRLAALGHIFHLVEGPPAGPREFPMMLYRDAPAAGGEAATKVVGSAEERDAALEDGWKMHETLEKKGSGDYADPNGASGAMGGLMDASNAPADRVNAAEVSSGAGEGTEDTGLRPVALDTVAGEGKPEDPEDPGPQNPAPVRGPVPPGRPSGISTDRPFSTKPPEPTDAASSSVDDPMKAPGGTSGASADSSSDQMKKESKPGSAAEASPTPSWEKK